MTTSNALFLPNARVRWVDENGMLTTVAIRALEQIFQRTGGTEGFTGAGGSETVIVSVDAMPVSTSFSSYQTDDGPPNLVTQFPDIPDDMATRIAALEARLIAAESLIAELREGTIT